jgi:hypothetical protein
MNLTAQARLEAQQELESLSVELGIARYRASLADGGDTAVSAGQQLMKAALQPMEAALKKWLEETAAGLASRSASLFHFINQLEPVTVAWLTGQGALGQLSTRPPMARLSVSVALQLEGAVNMDAICKANPKLGDKMGKRMAGMRTAGAQPARRIYADTPHRHTMRALLDAAGAAGAQVRVAFFKADGTLRYMQCEVCPGADSTARYVTVRDLMLSEDAERPAYRRVCLDTIAGVHVLVAPH